jgi:hypothetical protein
MACWAPAPSGVAALLRAEPVISALRASIAGAIITHHRRSPELGAAALRCYRYVMIKVLEDAIEKVKALPEVAPVV